MLTNCLICYLVLFFMTTLRVLVINDTMHKEMGILAAIKSM